MSNLYKVLYFVLALSLVVNFYMDYKRDLSYKAKVAAIDSIGAKPAPAEPSPFDKAPSDPLHSSLSTPTTGITTISFERTSHDFGRVESGPVYTTTFKYKNTGHTNLFISAADASCGCTVPTWSREAIKPGESGEIEVNFDSKGRTGEQLKTVTVTTNTEPNKNVLTLHSMLYLKK